jgi:hypothetical protein
VFGERDAHQRSLRAEHRERLAPLCANRRRAARRLLARSLPYSISTRDLAGRTSLRSAAPSSGVRQRSRLERRRNASDAATRRAAHRAGVRIARREIQHFRSLAVAEVKSALDTPPPRELSQLPSRRRATRLDRMKSSDRGRKARMRR